MKLLNIMLALFIFGNILFAFSSDTLKPEVSNAPSGIIRNTQQIIIKVFPLLLVGLLGYFAGKSIEFRKEKQKVYSDSIQPLLATKYGSKIPTEEELNKSNLRILLYSNREVAIKLQKATRILVKPERGDITEAFQELLSAMRKDVQLFSWLNWQKLKSTDFTHIYFNLESKRDDNSV